MRNYRFFIIVIVLVLVGWFFSGQLSPAKGTLNTLVTPVAKFFTASTTKVSNFFSIIGTISGLSRENAELRNANLNLQSELSQLKEVQHENEILKKELNFAQSQKNYSLIPAQIIGRSPSSFLRNLKIDKGSQDNVQTGRAVLSQGFLVGKVSQITPNTAEIEVINDSRSLVPALLQNSRGTGLVRGGLGGLIMEDIPTDTEIKIGEMVVTSGLGGNLPAGIPIGTVEKVVSSRSEIFQKISLRSPLEFNKLEIVFVVK